MSWLYANWLQEGSSKLKFLDIEFEPGFRNSFLGFGGTTFCLVPRAIWVCCADVVRQIFPAESCHSGAMGSRLIEETLFSVAVSNDDVPAAVTDV